jgi:hypothetical protein
LSHSENLAKILAKRQSNKILGSNFERLIDTQKKRADAEVATKTAAKDWRQWLTTRDDMKGLMNSKVVGNPLFSEAGKRYTNVDQARRMFNTGFNEELRSINLMPTRISLEMISRGGEPLAQMISKGHITQDVYVNAGMLMDSAIAYYNELIEADMPKGQESRKELYKDFSVDLMRARTKWRNLENGKRTVGQTVGDWKNLWSGEGTHIMDGIDTVNEDDILNNMIEYARSIQGVTEDGFPNIDDPAGVAYMNTIEDPEVKKLVEEDLARWRISMRGTADSDFVGPPAPGGIQ